MPSRLRPGQPPADHRHAGHHPEPDGSTAETVDQPVKVDNALYIRDYASCILCYKCVQACGEEAQNTFAIAVAAAEVAVGLDVVFVAEPESTRVLLEGEDAHILKSEFVRMRYMVQGLDTIFEDVLGLEFTGTEEVAEQKVKVAFLTVGESRIELLEQTAEDLLASS